MSVKVCEGSLSIGKSKFLSKHISYHGPLIFCFREAFLKAFSLLKNSSNPQCQRFIIFVTDGQNQDYGQRCSAGQWENVSFIFTTMLYFVSGAFYWRQERRYMEITIRKFRHVKLHKIKIVKQQRTWLLGSITGIILCSTPFILRSENNWTYFHSFCHLCNLSYLIIDHRDCSKWSCSYIWMRWNPCFIFAEAHLNCHNFCRNL